MAGKGKTKSKRPAVKPNDRLVLWVQAGGRCAICNRYLLANAFTGERVKVGEMAHIVGAQENPASPRGIDDVPWGERSRAENLILLCEPCHKTVDANVEQWPADRLRSCKRDHEREIAYLTSLRANAQTVVVRVMGDIRQTPAELSSEENVLAALRGARRYPFYVLGTEAGSDIECDLRKFSGEGEEVYWSSVKRRIEDLREQLRDAIARGQIKHLSVFAFARIPALVLLGDALDDKVRTDVYQRQRDDELGWAYDPGAEPVEFECERVLGSEGAADVTLVCSISGSVNLGEVPDAVKAGAVYELRPRGVTPSPTLFRSAATAGNFATAYRNFLARLEQAHPDAKRLAVVPAVPVAAAVELGRARMKEVHPALEVYDRVPGRGSGDRYALATTIAS
jgi:5-methylcytosine-specific restriction endonuclease McrA